MSIDLMFSIILSNFPCIYHWPLFTAGKGPLGRRNRPEAEPVPDRDRERDRDREPLDDRPPSRDPRDRRDRHTPETSDR